MAFRQENVRLWAVSGGNLKRIGLMRREYSIDLKFSTAKLPNFNESSTPLLMFYEYAVLWICYEYTEAVPSVAFRIQNRQVTGFP